MIISPNFTGDGVTIAELLNWFLALLLNKAKHSDEVFN
jgi:hypothetical protein